MHLCDIKDKGLGHSRTCGSYIKPKLVADPLIVIYIDWGYRVLHNSVLCPCFRALVAADVIKGRRPDGLITQWWEQMLMAPDRRTILAIDSSGQDGATGQHKSSVGLCSFCATMNRIRSRIYPYYWRCILSICLWRVHTYSGVPKLQL